MSFERVFSGAPWESRVGYCRALRSADRVFVTGTASVKDGSVHAPGDGYAQALRCLEIIDEALKELGADLSHVVRTRMFVTDISRWEEFGRAHGEVFAANPPTTSMVEVRALIDPEMLIEIEADAIVNSVAEPAHPADHSPFHLAFPVRNLAETRAFYVDRLGCRLGRSGSDWLDIDFFGNQIVAHVMEGGASALARAGTNRIDDHDVPPHFGAVLSMDRWREMAQRLADLAFVVAPHLRYKGALNEQASMIFEDPSGNVVELKALADQARLFQRHE